MKHASTSKSTSDTLRPSSEASATSSCSCSFTLKAGSGEALSPKAGLLLSPVVKAGPRRLSYQLIAALSAIVAETGKKEDKTGRFQGGPHSLSLPHEEGNVNSNTSGKSSGTGIGYGVHDDSHDGVPEATFLLQGEGTSGILLPSLCKFPSGSRGFTFSTWVCPKLASGAYSYRSRKLPRDNLSLSREGDREVGDNVSEKPSLPFVRPVLLSLLQRNGEGLTVHLEPKNCNASSGCNGSRQIVLTVWPPSKSICAPCTVAATLLTDNNDDAAAANDEGYDEDDTVWHHVAVTVQPGTYRSRGDVTLIVNGVSFSLTCAIHDNNVATASASASATATATATATASASASAAATARGGDGSSTGLGSGAALKHALCCSDACEALYAKDGGRVMPSPILGDVDPAHSHTFAQFIRSVENDKENKNRWSSPSAQSTNTKEREKAIRSTKVATSLCGRLGAIYFFDGPLSESAIKGIYGLGPRYRHGFDLTEYKDLYERSNVTSTSTARAGSGMESGGSRNRRSNTSLARDMELFDGTLRAALMLALNPCVVTRAVGRVHKSGNGSNHQTGGGYDSHGTPTDQFTSPGDAGSGAPTGDTLIVDITPSRNRVRWQASCVATLGGSRKAGGSENRTDPAAVSRQQKANTLLAMASTTGSDSTSRSARLEMENWYPHAMCRPNTFCDYNYDIRDALDCLGGAMVLLPLLRGLMVRDNSQTGPGAAVTETSFSIFSIDEVVVQGQGGSREGESSDMNLAVVMTDMIFRLLRPGASSNRLVDVGLFPLLAQTLCHLPQRMKTRELFETVSGHCQRFMNRNVYVPS